MTRTMRGAVAGVLLLATLYAATGVAAAHAVLLSTDPIREAQLSRGPAGVSATFNEQLQPDFAAMTVVGPDGHLWSTGETQVDGAAARVGVLPLGPTGTYTVHYRVTSADGHVVSGSWPFQLTVAGSGKPGPALSEQTASSRVPSHYADREDELPIWPFVGGAVVLVAAGIWLNRPRS